MKERRITETVEVLRMSQGGAKTAMEEVACETAVHFYYDDGRSSLVSCTPDNIEDLLYGFSFSVGAINSPEDIVSYQIDEKQNGLIDIFITLSASTDKPNSPITGAPCALEAFWTSDDANSSVNLAKRIRPEIIWKTSGSLLSWQRMHQMTGATHAAAFVDFSGHPLCVREDIGRHNAVDKMLGALIRDKVDPSSGFVYLSSRCALDLVMRCVRYGIAVVATVSAPTSAVITFAEDAGVTLCAYARERRFTVYTHPERIAMPSAESVFATVDKKSALSGCAR